MNIPVSYDMLLQVDALTNPNSSYYNEEFTNSIINQYGTIGTYKGLLRANEIADMDFPIKAFTSYDGVDIMVGEPFYYFNNNFENFNAITKSKGATPFDVTLTNKKQRTAEGKNPMKFFSSLEAIEEYAMMNEACISINDLSKWMNEDNEFNGINIQDLFEIVKGKL